MEHIVQFGIGIDDDAIIRELERSAVKNIEKDIKQELINKLFDPPRYKHADPQRDALSDWTKSIIETCINEHKTEIIDKAAKYLADSMRRTKAVKEAITQMNKQD